MVFFCFCQYHLPVVQHLEDELPGFGFLWLGSPSIYVSHLSHGRGATLLRGLMNHGPWLLTTYETWDDPPSNGYGALVKSELSNKMFFFRRRSKNSKKPWRRRKMHKRCLLSISDVNKEPLGESHDPFAHISHSNLCNLHLP